MPSRVICPFLFVSLITRELKVLEQWDSHQTCTTTDQICRKICPKPQIWANYQWEPFQKFQWKKFFEEKKFKSWANFWVLLLKICILPGLFVVQITLSILLTQCLWKQNLKMFCGLGDISLGKLPHHNFSGGVICPPKSFCCHWYHW